VSKELILMKIPLVQRIDFMELRDIPRLPVLCKGKPDFFIILNAKS